MDLCFDLIWYGRQKLLEKIAIKSKFGNRIPNQSFTSTWVSNCARNI